MGTRCGPWYKPTCTLYLWSKFDVRRIGRNFHVFVLQTSAIDGNPRLAQREAAQAHGLSERQDTVQGRLEPRGAVGDEPRHSQGRAANGLLHRNWQHAPPPPRPSGGGGSSKGRRRTECPHADEFMFLASATEGMRPPLQKGCPDATRSFGEDSVFRTAAMFFGRFCCYVVELHRSKLKNKDIA